MTLTYTQARDALVAYINTQIATAYPTLKVFWENRLQVDPVTVGDRFLQIGIDFEDAVAATLHAETDFVTGMIGFRYFVREGKGTRETLQVFDTLNALFRQRDYAGVRTETPYPGPKSIEDGWMSSDFQIPFSYYG